ncbi:MAG TPA: helix-turn-helix domain-containing protein [Hyphomicrobium zavarzinii]|nr:helix-turn-helix domain-containing protein [Hyphomicrobium zavarzinii]
MSDPFPDQIDEALWDEACRRADAIRGFLRRHPARTTAGNVAGLAAELGLSQATAYRMVKLFRAGGTVLSLVDRKRGRPEGHRMLDEKREEIVRTTINAFYLKRTRPTVSQLVRDVQTNCMSAGLKPPHRRTIVARLGDIDLQKRARRRGEQKIVKATTAVAGAFGASRPLEVVQIDCPSSDALAQTGVAISGEFCSSTG